MEREKIGKGNGKDRKRKGKERERTGIVKEGDIGGILIFKPMHIFHT